MATKELKLFNGRAIGLGNRLERAHLWIAAYSMADARRVCVEAGYRDPGANEVKVYWSHGCWGNSMDGITPERGLWIAEDHWQTKPIRQQPVKP